MVGGFATSEVVVVHRGQVVMDEAHGVNHLQRARRGHRCLHGSAHQLAAGQGAGHSRATNTRGETQPASWGVPRVGYSTGFSPFP